MHDWRTDYEELLDEGDVDAGRPSPGKVTLTRHLEGERAPRRAASAQPVQRIAHPAAHDEAWAGAYCLGGDVHAEAARGVAGGGSVLPHLSDIQLSFGHHDVTGVRAHVGGAAATAAQAIGAEAYATGNDVAFAGAPGLRQAAHEAAHVVQQRGGVRLDGGVGVAGDPYEQHADAVADLVVRGESAESLLDTMAHRGPAGGDAVQRWSWSEGTRRAQAVEGTQVWDESAAETPLAGDDGTRAAVQANARLGFTNDNIRLLRIALGLPTNCGPIIDRAFVEAVRVRQGGAACDEPVSVAPSGGVLDEPTVFAIDPGAGRAGIGRARSHYRSEAPWAGITAPDFEAIVSALVSALPGMTASEISLDSRGRVTITQRFYERVIAWQMWHRRSVEVPRGQLTAADLSEMGAPVPASASASATAAAPAGEGAASAAPAVDTAADAEASAPEGASADGAEAEVEEPRDEQGLTAPERERLEGFRRELRDYFRDRLRARGDSERQATVDRDIEPRLNAMRSALEDMERPNLDFTVFDRYQTPNRARWMDAELRSQMGEVVEGHGGEAAAPRPGAGGAAAAPTGPVRRSAAESRRALDEGGYVIGEGESRVREGWDGRTMHRGASATASADEVAVESHRVVADFDEAIGHLEAAKERIEQAGDNLRSVLTSLCGVTYSPIHRIRHDDRAIRVPWRLADAERIREESDAQLRSRATRWTRALTREIGALRTDSRAQAGYGSLPHRTSGLVTVDLNRSGVTILNNQGSQLPTSLMTLDPQFADAMVRFLGEIGSLGASAMWTAGFVRSFISPMDTHPLGRACDITGFQFGDTLLHLRSGYPMDPPPATSQSDYDDVHSGHSDWFDHHGQFPDGRTHEEVMHAITARMRSYFSRIIGPGANRRHMGHWHVELSGRPSRSPQIQAIRRDTDMPEDVRDRSDRRSPDWMTPSERASFPDGSE